MAIGSNAEHTRKATNATTNARTGNSGIVGFVEGEAV